MVQSKGDKPICALHFPVIVFLRPAASRCFSPCLLNAVCRSVSNEAELTQPESVTSSSSCSQFCLSYTLALLHGSITMAAFFPLFCDFSLKNSNKKKKGRLRSYCGTALPSQQCGGDARIFLNNSGITLQ